MLMILLVVVIPIATVVWLVHNNDLIIPDEEE